MKCDSRALFLARTFASPCFGRKPKVRVATVGISMEWDMLIQHLELMVVCEKSSTYADDNKVILDMHPLMKGG
jgi:hypothetical protein